MTRRKKYDIRNNAGENNEEEIPVPMPNNQNEKDNSLMSKRKKYYKTPKHKYHDK